MMMLPLSVQSSSGKRARLLKLTQDHRFDGQKLDSTVAGGLAHRAF